jgi:hypothetical protein
MKSWKKFNENANIDLKSKISEKITEVRDVFLEFEDMGIITYTVISSGFERGAYSSFDPKRGDFDRFLDMIIPTVKLGIKKDDELGGPGLAHKYKNIGRKSSYTVSDKDFCIITDIKIPGEPNEFGSTVIGNEGIKIFEDILVANSRLIDMGYDVKLDLNASHNAYKPVKFLIYFNI